MVLISSAARLITHDPHAFNIAASSKTSFLTPGCMIGVLYSAAWANPWFGRGGYNVCPTRPQWVSFFVSQTRRRS